MKNTLATVSHVLCISKFSAVEGGVVFRVTKDDFSSHILSVFHTSPSDPHTSIILGVRILFEQGNTDSRSQKSDRVQLSILAPLLEDESWVNEYDKLCGA